MNASAAVPFVAVGVVVLCGLWWWRRRTPARRLRRLVLRQPPAGPGRGLPGGLVGRVSGRPIATAVVAAGLLVVGMTFLGGPVAGLIAAAYGAVAIVEWRSVLIRRAAERDRHAAVDAIGALAAELRAGLAPDRALLETLVPHPHPHPDLGPGHGPRAPAGGGTEGRAGRRRLSRRTTTVGRVPVDPVLRQATQRVAAARSISDSLGAPMADLFDRIDHDLRAAQRLRATVAAQTGGARATALLLAGLPVAGLALGGGFGVDPLDVLLHTPFGAACASMSLALQVGGLWWTGRLTRGAVEAVT